MESYEYEGQEQAMKRVRFAGITTTAKSNPAGKSAMSELDDRAWSDAEETDDDEAEKEVAEHLAEDPASDDGHAYHYHRGHGSEGHDRRRGSDL